MNAVVQATNQDSRTGESLLAQLLAKDRSEPINANELLLNDRVFERLEAIARMMASGKATVPQHLRGSVGDCMAIAMQAARWRMDPWAVAQKTHIVNGIIGYEAQLVNAVIISLAPVKARLQFEWGGDWSKVIGKTERRESKKEGGGFYYVPAWSHQDEEGLFCKVWATLRGEDEPRELPLYLKQATVRNSTLWASDPKQQLAYLAIKRWARLHCPDVIMGVYTPDELEEVDHVPPLTLPVDSQEPEAKPASRSAAVASKFRKSSDPVEKTEAKRAEDIPSYTPAQKAEILEAIRTAPNGKAASAAAKRAAEILKGSDLEEAKAAFATRRREIEEAAAKLREQQAAAEAQKQAEEPADPAPVDWRADIAKCENVDELDRVVDRINQCVDMESAERDRLIGLAIDRQAELES
jgi:hypothetical protein